MSAISRLRATAAELREQQDGGNRCYHRLYAKEAEELVTEIASAPPSVGERERAVVACKNEINNAIDGTIYAEREPDNRSHIRAIRRHLLKAGSALNLLAAPPATAAEPPRADLAEALGMFEDIPDGSRFTMSPGQAVMVRNLLRAIAAAEPPASSGGEEQITKAERRVVEASLALAVADAEAERVLLDFRAEDEARVRASTATDEWHAAVAALAALRAPKVKP